MNSDKINFNKQLASAAAVMVLAAVAIIGLGNILHGSVKQQINATTTITQTQQIFASELNRTAAINQIRVTYVSLNNSRHTTVYHNKTAVAVTTQTITSLLLSSNTVSFLNSSVQVIDPQTNSVVYSNNSDTAYYKINNRTFVCVSYVLFSINKTDTHATCTNMTLPYFSSFPFYIKNISSIKALANNTALAYRGRGIINGRSCDGFTLDISSKLAGNITQKAAYVLCLDPRYGIPVYYNITRGFNGRITSSEAIVATSISTNVSAADFVEPRNVSS